MRKIFWAADDAVRSELDCTCAEFLERVYGPRSKPCTEAVKTMFTVAR